MSLASQGLKNAAQLQLNHAVVEILEGPAWWAG
jgi:hypothetical protein